MRCAVCALGAWRETRAGLGGCQRHWAALAHYETFGHAPANVMRLALAATRPRVGK